MVNLFYFIFPHFWIFKKSRGCSPDLWYFPDDLFYFIWQFSYFSYFSWAISRPYTHFLFFLNFFLIFYQQICSFYFIFPNSFALNSTQFSISIYFLIFVEYLRTIVFSIKTLWRRKTSGSAKKVGKWDVGCWFPGNWYISVNTSPNVLKLCILRNMIWAPTWNIF